MVFCKDAETCRELHEYLRDPAALQERRFARYLSKLFKRHKALLIQKDPNTADLQTKRNQDEAVREAKRAKHRYDSSHIFKC